MDWRRFRQLFIRQFLVLLLVSVGLVAVLEVAHAVAEQSQGAWLRFAVLDLVVLVAGSGLSAWVKLYAEERRHR